MADVYEAMISHRPYRPSLGKQAAIEELSRNRGLLYNADAVDVCVNLLSNEGFDFNDGNANGARQKGMSSRKEAVIFCSECQLER